MDPSAKKPVSPPAEGAGALSQEEKGLVETATTGASPESRLEAVRKLGAGRALAEVVRSGGSLDARLEALGRIEDQNLLAQIIYEVNDEEIMKAAFEGITNAKVLAKIAEDARYGYEARRTAIDSFADQGFLQEVVPHPESELKRDTDGRPAATDAEEAGDGADASVASPMGILKHSENIEELLQQFGPHRIIDAIGRFRGSKRAVRALGLIARKGIEGSDRALHFLEKALKHANPSIRISAIQEVVGIPQKEKAADLLAALREDPDSEVKQAAEVAFGQIAS